MSLGVFRGSVRSAAAPPGEISLGGGFLHATLAGAESTCSLVYERCLRLPSVRTLNVEPVSFGGEALNTAEISNRL